LASVVAYFSAVVIGLLTLGNWWVTVPAVLMASAMGLRIYMIQHDCLHRSFFTSRRLNDGVGSLLSPIAMTPYKATRHIHGLHHTYVSDLERRDAFEIFTMTLKEWQAASARARLQYRYYRSPVVLILIGPFVLYGILRRMPLYGLKTGLGDLIFHNVLLGSYIGVIWWATGWAGVGFWVASVYFACVFGSLIPYIVHNFEDVHWGRRPELTFASAALQGSAVLDWGRMFDLVTMNIGYHDLHHLNAKIPGYKLRAAHATLEAEGHLESEKIKFFQGLGCLRWKLYDEDSGRMIAFPARANSRSNQNPSVPAE
jgi:omega-6 fatty acid desaturase (delta-12 desaturase)